MLAIGVRTLAEHNAVMKQLHSVETLGSATVIASDKTGTLTRNEMTLTEIVTASGPVVLTGSGYDPAGTAEVDGGEDAEHEARLLLTAGVRANNAQLDHADDQWEIQGDPTEAAFVVAQHKLDGVAERADRFTRAGEVPFSSERKMMSVLDRSDADEQRIFSKGAPDVLLERCTALQVGDQTRPMADEDRLRQQEIVEELSARGYRTLGVAWREPHSAGGDDARSPAGTSLSPPNGTSPTSASSASSTRHARRRRTPSPRRTVPASAPS